MNKQTCKSKYHLNFIMNNKSAFTIPYARLLIAFFLLFLCCYIQFPLLFHIINNIFFLSQSFLKIILFVVSLLKAERRASFREVFTSEFCKTRLCSRTQVRSAASLLNSPCKDLSEFSPSLNKNKRVKFSEYNVKRHSLVKALENDALPVYSIMTPLYKEPEKLEEIIYFISSLTYPISKLDIHILIEEDDKDTVNKITELKNAGKVPPFINFIKIPYSLPRTKPKALNYGLEYCKGEYVVVYDAEDRPEHGQLLKSVSTFRALPENYICLQAKLNFYNSHENLLCSFFSLEYLIWFNYLLKALSVLNLPMPLGGTSNHFKTQKLKEIGAWDAYNVTEDAELGIRLFLLGYASALLDSYTLEESPITIDNWMHQRSRWIKGYLQTFLTYILYYLPNYQFKTGIAFNIIIFIFLCLTCYNLFVFPWLIYSFFYIKDSIVNYLWIINSFAAFAYIYSSTAYVLFNNRNIFKIRGNRIKHSGYMFFTITLFPFYFILHVIASYFAIFEIIVKPFAWNKTRHGESKVK